MSKILANVGGFPITEDDVNEFLQGLGQRGQAYNNPEGKRAVLEQLISNKLLLLDARRNLLEADPVFKAELNRVKENLLVSFAAEKAFSAVSVSDKEAEEYYEANKERFMSEETVNASHILVDSEEKALQILAEIKSGETSFEDAARTNSTCPSGGRGGNLGDFGRGQMVPEFDEAAFSMAEGEISDKPVQTQFGYHLIKLNSKKPSEIMPFAELAPEIKEALLQQKRQKAYESKINQLKILYPVDLV